jgi:thioredoxin reductase
MRTPPHDVAIIGGSVAGLSTALVLAQARRDVLVLDAGHPRNAPAARLHGYLGRDGATPSELVAIGRDEVARHGGRLRTATVTSVGGDVGAFTLETSDGDRVDARVVVVATGLVDQLPDLPGIEEGWGRDVLHCPYCHGVEVAGQPVGVLGGTAMDSFRAQLVRQWTDDVVLFVDDPAQLSETERIELRARDIEVVGGPATALHRDANGSLRAVGLEGGRLVPRSAVFVWAPPTPTDELLRHLGVATDELPPFGAWPQVAPDGRTDVPGVWAVGNVAEPRANLIAATAQGAYAAAMINHDLVTMDVEEAVQRSS